MRLRAITVVVTALATVALGVGISTPADAAVRVTGTAAGASGVVTVGAPSEAGSTAAWVGHVVASGPGWTLVGSGPRTPRSPLARPNTVYDCGWVTCSVYLSRAQTRWLNYNIALAGGGIAGLAAFCGLIALVSNVAAIFVGVGCAAVVAIYGGFIINAITHAAADNGCFRIRYPAWAFYDDHSGFCHNT